jgi:creatinine amidohydrolase/Fe(II)-dependent formamide hydrolase-like protein
MLMALDVPPDRCGYKADQIDACLRQFPAKGVSQEENGYRQLGYMLMQKGLINTPKSKPAFFQEQPQILKMRFDATVSPINAMPHNLREPLYKMFLEHATGAVRRIGRSWRDYDPLSEPDLHKPFVFEIGPVGHATKEREMERPDASSFLWGELTWPEARSRLAETDIALLPVGSIEQHGPHLPLDTDTYDAELLARRVAEACSLPRPLVLPVVAYGVSYHHDDFKGTVSISNDTLSRLTYEIGMSVAQNGIRKLVIINGHGGNSPALNYAAQLINRDSRIFACVDTGETSDIDIYRIIDTPNDVHAGEIETSTALAVRPHLVKMGEAEASVPKFSSRYLDFTSKRGVSWYAATNKISSSGILGDPTKASAEKGRKIWEIMIAHLVALVEDLKDMSLEEIHHKNE